MPDPSRPPFDADALARIRAGADAALGANPELAAVAVACLWRRGYAAPADSMLVLPDGTPPDAATLRAMIESIGLFQARLRDLAARAESPPEAHREEPPTC